MSNNDVPVERKNVADTLEQRKSIYGSYGAGLELRANIMTAINEHYKKHAGNYMELVDQEYIWDIVNKLARVASCPHHVDSWHDIGGYASRIEEDLIKRGVGI